MAEKARSEAELLRLAKEELIALGHKNGELSHQKIEDKLSSFESMDAQQFEEFLQLLETEGI